MNTAFRTQSRRVLAILPLVVALVTWGAAPVAAQPVIDGNGDDLIAFADGFPCAVDRTDPRDDIALEDPTIRGCAPLEDTDGDSAADYYVNGKDLRRFVAVFDVAGRDLYILFRAEGVIGDIDGNGNPDDSLCEPPAGFVDPAGIGSEDRYEARFDRNCDGIHEITVRVENNQVTVFGLSPQLVRFAFAGHDLEVALYNIGLNPPGFFQATASSGAVHDGLGEDQVPVTQCAVPTPMIEITIVDMYPGWICSGEMLSEVTLEVSNTGDVGMDVTVVAQMPDPLDFARSVSRSCGGAELVNGDEVRWGPFTMAGRASCQIRFLVSRSGPCEGDRSILARAEGRSTSSCSNGGEPALAQATALASMRCVNLDCTISTPSTEVCAGGTVELCGPEYPEGFFSYTWSHGAYERCTTVGPGTYSLTVNDKNRTCINTCQITIREIPCGDACPRPVGFWGAQCAQKNNGSTKYTGAEMALIAECADDRSSLFDWSPGTDFDLFCRSVDPPPPMTTRRQAKRQFAGVLANLCATSLGLQPSRGGTIHLGTSTPISCDGLEADTIGELIDEVDGILAELEGEDLNDPSVKDRYGALISCLDAINNGTNIPTGDCSEERADSADETGGLGLLNRAVPNPFSSRMSFAYEVTGAEQAVEIGVYNVAGRLVKSLARGAMPAGRHTAAWDGTDGSGDRVPSGVYFVRVRLGVEVQQHRVIFLGK